MLNIGIYFETLRDVEDEDEEKLRESTYFILYDSF